MAAEITKPFLREVVRFLPPGGFDRVDVPGEFARCKEATGSFLLGVENEPEVQFDVGMAYRCPEGERFRVITLRNPGAVVISVSLLIGLGDIRDDRLNVIRERPAALTPVLEAETETEGSAVVSIAAGVGETLTPALTGRRIQRKAVVVSNRDAAGAELQMRDAAGVVFGIVFPQTTQIYHVSDVVEVFNPGVLGVACQLGQIYWLTPP